MATTSRRWCYAIETTRVMATTSPLPGVYPKFDFHTGPRGPPPVWRPSSGSTSRWGRCATRCTTTLAAPPLRGRADASPHRVDARAGRAGGRTRGARPRGTRRRRRLRRRRSCVPPGRARAPDRGVGSGGRGRAALPLRRDGGRLRWRERWTYGGDIARRCRLGCDGQAGRHRHEGGDAVCRIERTSRATSARPATCTTSSMRSRR